MAENKRELVKEIETLQNENANLKLYLRAIFKYSPYVKRMMMQRFAGMPGYTDKEAENGKR